jgi:hypothetical protein
MRRWLLSAASAVLASTLALAGRPAPAGHAAIPPGSAVLVVSGAIATAGEPQRVSFDLAALSRFPVRDLYTKTHWHEGVQPFRGVPALTVLEALGVREGTLTLSAADGYEVRLPLAALRAHEPILALEWEGDSLADEAEGPLWLVFPYDGMGPEERERYTAWSVWALREIRAGH